MLTGVHHIAIICSDYQKSKKFYTEVLGLKILRENYRKERDSYKLDLSLNGIYIIELFSFPSPPPRPSRPEAVGLRHLAFSTPNIEEEIERLQKLGITTEPIRIDEFTGKKFTFLKIPTIYP